MTPLPPRQSELLAQQRPLAAAPGPEPISPPEWLGKNQPRRDPGVPREYLAQQFRPVAPAAAGQQDPGGRERGGPLERPADDPFHRGQRLVVRQVTPPAHDPPAQEPGPVAVE